jgi:serine/threonine protein phosphatase 1
MDEFRDEGIEADLQTTLKKGGNVWVIGDVHGFNDTLRQLVASLELTIDDRVVLLGDLIDRGPDSFDVVRFAREDPRIHCIKGNHEAMMVENFDLERIDHPDQGVHKWLYNGGHETVASYIRAFPEDAKGALEWMIEADVVWMRSLPAHIVLDQWRLVHAGYNPKLGMNEQGLDELLWIRKPFHTAHQPLDLKRTVVFGHTPTMNLYPRSENRWGEVWYSDTKLSDGRFASIGMDTCVFHKTEQPAVLSAFNLQTHEVRIMTRCEPWVEADWVEARSRQYVRKASLSS